MVLVWLFGFCFVGFVFFSLIPSVTWWASRLWFELGLFNFFTSQTGGNVGEGEKERFIVQTPKRRSYLLPQSIGLRCPGFGSGRAAGVASARRDQRLSPCWT